MADSNNDSKDMGNIKLSFSDDIQDHMDTLGVKENELQDAMNHAFEDMSDDDCSFSLSSGDEHESVEEIKTEEISQQFSKPLLSIERSYASEDPTTHESNFTHSVVADQNSDIRNSIPSITDRKSVTFSEKPTEVSRPPSRGSRKAIENLKAQLLEREEQILNLQNNLNQLELEHESIKKDLVVEQQAKNSIFEKLQASESTAKNAFEQLEKTIKLQDEEISLLEGIKDGLEKAIAELQVANVRLQEQLESKDNQINHLGTKVLELELVCKSNIKVESPNAIESEVEIVNVTSEDNEIQVVEVISPDSEDESSRVVLETMIQELKKQNYLYKHNKSDLHKQLKYMHSHLDKMEMVLKNMQETHMPIEVHEGILLKITMEHDIILNDVKSDMEKMDINCRMQVEKLMRHCDVSNKIIDTYKRKIAHLERELEQTKDSGTSTPSNNGRDGTGADSQEHVSWETEQKNFLQALLEFITQEIRAAFATEREGAVDAFERMNRDNAILLENFLNNVLVKELCHFKAKCEAEAESAAVRKCQKYMEVLLDGIEAISNTLLNAVRTSLAEELIHAKKLMKTVQHVLHELFTSVPNFEATQEQTSCKKVVQRRSQCPVSSVFRQLPKEQLPSEVLQNLIGVEIGDADRDVRDFNYLVAKYVFADQK